MNIINILDILKLNVIVNESLVSYTMKRDLTGLPNYYPPEGKFESDHEIVFLPIDKSDFKQDDSYHFGLRYFISFVHNPIINIGLDPSNPRITIITLSLGIQRIRYEILGPDCIRFNKGYDFLYPIREFNLTANSEMVEDLVNNFIKNISTEYNNFYLGKNI